ncbi:MAG: hypothetical protein WBR15_08410 [Gammaproteobacteria bacterium]
MKSLIWFMANVLLLMGLTGCTTWYNVYGNYSLEEARANGHGLLIGSTSSHTDSAYTATIVFYYAPVEMPPPGEDAQAREARRVFNMRHGMFSFKSNCGGMQDSASDFPDVCGHIFAMDFQAGEYELTGWRMENGTGGVITPKKWSPVYFTIHAGQATYVGDLIMNIFKARNLFGINIIAGGWPEVTDERGRDLPMLRHKYDTLNDGNIVIQIISFPPLPKEPTQMEVPINPLPPHPPLLSGESKTEQLGYKYD